MFEAEFFVVEIETNICFNQKKYLIEPETNICFKQKQILYQDKHFLKAASVTVLVLVGK